MRYSLKHDQQFWSFNANAASAALHILGFCCLLLAVIGLVVLVRQAIRGMRIPVCYACSATRVRRLHSTTNFDKFARVFFFRTYRCSACLVRFHALPPLLESNRAVKIVFHFGDGFQIRIRTVDMASGSQGLASDTLDRPL